MSVQYAPQPAPPPERPRLKIVGKISSPSTILKTELEPQLPAPRDAVSQSTQTSVVIRASQEPVRPQTQHEVVFRVPESQLAFRWQAGPANTPQHDVTFSDNLE